MNNEELYEKYKEIIEEMASRFKNNTFGYLDQEDIKQEVRIFCLNALKQFNDTDSSPRVYLQKCVSNRMKNFKRDNYFRKEKPCVKNKCSLYDVFSGSCMSNFYETEMCPYVKDAEEKEKKQTNLVNTVSINDVENSDHISDDLLYKNNDKDALDFNDLNFEIRKNIAESSGQYFAINYDKLLLHGKKTIGNEEYGFIKMISSDILYG